MLTQALLLPELKAETEGCTIDASIFQPDPNECRHQSGTYCCNKLYYQTIRLSMLERSERNYYLLEEARRQSLPTPPEPATIDLDHLDVFEAQALNRGSRVWPGSDPSQLEYFALHCWLTLSDWDTRLLFPDVMQERGRGDSDIYRRSSLLMVKCGEKEIVRFFRRVPRRQWSPPAFPSGKLLYPRKYLEDARCVKLSDKNWSEYQRLAAVTRASRAQLVQRLVDDHSTDPMSSPYSSLDAHLSHSAESSNRIVVQPGSVTTCLDFPSLQSPIDRGSNNKSPPTVPMRNTHIPKVIRRKTNIEARDRSTLSDVVDNHWTLVARMTELDERTTRLQNGMNELQRQAEQYSAAIRASSLDPAWDYPEVYDTAAVDTATDQHWDYPELYANNEALPAIVSQMNIQLVSRSPSTDFRQTTVVSRAIGPSSFLKFTPADSISQPAQVSANQEHIPPSQRTLNLELIPQACVTTMPNGGPIQFWTELLDLPTQNQ